ncbi:class I SAM-dependent methyltransferase [Streptomyces sp. 1268]|uniref:class I SAM-dependent methyltransferase n=1 Tax=Streptomyces sp. 1268 TaxID=3231942 RepID=UPI0038D490A9
MPTTAAAYWEPLSAQGRRYRQLDDAENRLLENHLGPGRDRPALDIGCGDGSLTRHLAQLGYRTTGIDCSPSAVTLAAARAPGPGHELVRRCMNITTDELGFLPEPAYAVTTLPTVLPVGRRQSRLPRSRPPPPCPGRGLLDRHRDLRTPRRCRPLAGPGDHPRPGRDPHLGMVPVHTADLDVLRCYALRP